MRSQCFAGEALNSARAPAGQSLSKAVEELHDKVHLLDKGSLSSLGSTVTDVTKKLQVWRCPPRRWDHCQSLRYCCSTCHALQEAAATKKELSKQNSEKVNTGASPTVEPLHRCLLARALCACRAPRDTSECRMTTQNGKHMKRASLAAFSC